MSEFLSGTDANVKLGMEAYMRRGACGGCGSAGAEWHIHTWSLFILK